MTELTAHQTIALDCLRLANGDTERAQKMIAWIDQQKVNQERVSSESVFRSTLTDAQAQHNRWQSDKISADVREPGLCRSTLFDEAPDKISADVREGDALYFGGEKTQAGGDRPGLDDTTLDEIEKRLRLSMEAELETALATSLNIHSREKMSRTPDFVLARFLVGCLAAYERATRDREAWSVPAPTTAEANFGLYVDGFTLAGTGVIGEIRLTNPDGGTTLIPSARFTEWAWRMFHPS